MKKYCNLWQNIWNKISKINKSRNFDTCSYVILTTITEALFLEVRLGAGWALSPPNFDVFPKLSNFLRYYCTSFGNSWGNSCTMFYTKYQVLLYLWWSLKFLKCFKVPKCYVHDFLRIHCIKKWGLHFRISSVNPQKTLVTFTQEILNGKLHFFVQWQERVCKP